MTASLPYASRNGVSPVGVFAVVCYAHWQLVLPDTLCPLELGLDDFEQGSVRDFNLPIGLWVCGRRVVILDT